MEKIKHLSAPLPKATKKKPEKATGHFLPNHIFSPIWLLFTWTLPMLIQLGWYWYGAISGDGRIETEFMVPCILNLCASLMAFAYLRKTQDPSQPKPWLVLMAYQCFFFSFLIVSGGLDNSPMEGTHDIQELFSTPYCMSLVPALHIVLAAAAIRFGEGNFLNYFWPCFGLSLAGGFISFFAIKGISYDLSYGGVIPAMAATGCFFVIVARTQLILGKKVNPIARKAMSTLALPLGGMMLNNGMEFPVDLQSPWMYGLIIFTGAILVSPTPERKAARSILFALRCLAFPFSLYFFLVFLPVLPLAPFLIAAFGTGFLVLSPLAMFCIHLHLLREGTKQWDSQGGWRKVGLMAACVTFLPGVLVAKSLVESHYFLRAMNHVHVPDLERKQGVYISNLPLTQHAVRKYSDDSFADLPYLDSFEWWKNVHRHRLRDQKVNDALHAFTGRAKPFRDWHNRSSSLDRRVGMKVAGIEQYSDGKDPKVLRSRVALELTNISHERNEYVAWLDLPEGVFVTGYWLDVLGTEVAGRIFEAKVAQSEYQGINPYCGDPGFLSYVSPTRLALRVSPFLKEETRKTWIEFLHPAGSQPVIQIGKERIGLIGKGVGEGIHVTQTDFGTWVYLAGPRIKSLPKVTREPYLHIDIDSSKDSEDTYLTLGRKLVRMVGDDPKASTFALSFSNFQTLQVPGLRPIQELEEAGELEANVKKNGGYLLNHAKAHALYRYRDEFLDSGNLGTALKYPIFSSYQSTRVPCNIDLQTTELERAWVPEANGAKKVTLLKMGGHIRPAVVPGIEDAGVAIQFPSMDKEMPLEVFDPSSGSWKELSAPVIYPEDSPYAEAASLMLLATQSARNPAHYFANRKKITKRSKSLNVLTRGTAFLVLDEEDRWARAETQERETLETHPAMEPYGYSKDWLGSGKTSEEALLEPLPTEPNLIDRY